MDICYPEGTDWGCAYSEEEIAALLPEPRERAEALAWSTLSALTGFRVSLCPTMVRPCAARCLPGTYFAASVVGGGSGTFSPYLMGGVWFNGCGCMSPMGCGCSSVSEVILPTEVGKIVLVTVNGTAVPSTEYRVDNGNRLVRLDGQAWPLCQDMAQGLDGDNSFGVSYYSGVAPNDLLRYAAGLLAAEYYKACTGKQCRLPQGVTNVTRNGITMDIPGGLFPSGATGIQQVDTIIRIYNPHNLKGPSRVLSPDTMRGRVQTGA